jgi:hypothetical protein
MSTDRISSESQPASNLVAISNVSRPERARSSDDSNKKTAELSGLSVFQESSTHSLALEKQGESELDVAASSVVRVGEPGGSGEPKLAPQADSFVAITQTSNRQEASIPPDYMEAIREWLGSPPSRSEAMESQGLADRNREEVSTAPGPGDRSLPSNFVDRDSGPQNDIQEFSLSIGSISIIVEEPAQQPKQQPRIGRPVESPSAGAQPRARDAFALSRNYFRGF